MRSVFILNLLKRKEHTRTAKKIKDSEDGASNFIHLTFSINAKNQYNSMNFDINKSFEMLEKYLFCDK